MSGATTRRRMAGPKRGGARSRRGVAVAAALALAASVATGCDVVTSVGPQSCDLEPEENPPVTYRGGSVEGGVYMSSPWDRDLIYFPGGMQVRLEHGLGVAPRSWSAFLSFQAEGSRDGGSLAPAAGNQVELVDVDDVAMTVRNSTCADYYVLITAEAEAPAPPDVDG